MNEATLVNPKIFNYICRACLGTQNLLPLKDIKWENISLRKVLYQFLDFQDDLESKMPQNICNICSKEFYHFWTYLSHVKNNYLLLKESLDQNLETLPVLKSEEALVDDKNITEDEEQDNDNGYNHDTGSDLDNKSDIADIFDGEDPIKDEKTKELLTEIKSVKLDIRKIRKNAHKKILKRRYVNSKNTSEPDHPDSKTFPSDNGSLGPYTCVTCDTGFSSHQDLLAHKSKMKHKGSVFICPYCQKKTTNHPRFQIHLRTHTKERPNKCTICGKGFNDKGDVQRHVRHVHIGLKKFKCSICNMRFKRKHYLTDHQRKHTNTKLVCHFCGESFQSVYALYRHEKVHKQQEAKNNGTEGSIQKDKFRCDICDKVLYSDITLKDHVLLHGPRDFNCEVCGKCYTTAKRLKAHKSVSHEEGKYPCEHCDKVYKQKYVLAQHVEKEHFGTTPSYKCEYCDKDFVYKSSLRMHLRIHTGNTQYQCKECLKICISQRNLNIHMRNHTGEKPYSCTFCDRKFACPSNMKSHMKTHTGERMHLCSLCPKGFYTANALKKHMKTHDKDRTVTVGESERKYVNSEVQHKGESGQKADYIIF